MPLELIVGAAVGAAVASTKVRQVVRRGVVYGLAGILVAYDKAARVTHAVVNEAHQEAETKPTAALPTTQPTPAPGQENVTSAPAG